MTLIRSYDDLSTMEKMSLINMSYSRIDTFMSCQAKYFYNYITKEPTTFGPAAAMGTVVHSVMEETNLNDLDLDCIIAELETQFAAQDPDNQIDEGLRSAAEKCVTDFVDTHSGDTFHVYEREMEFDVVIGNGLFKGFIDLVEMDEDGNILIRDWKTGKFEVSKPKAAENLQLGLYAVVSRYLFPEAKSIRAELYYMRSGNRPGHTYTNQDLDRMEIIIRDLTTLISSTTNFSYTKNTFLCTRMCDHGKSGACPRGAAITRKYN